MTSKHIPYYYIQDDVEHADKTRLCIIFSTKRLLSFLTKSSTLHIDAIYRLNWQVYPVMTVGVSSVTSKFFGSMSVLSSHEDSEALAEIYAFIHGLIVHPKFRIGDGAQSIKRGIILYAHLSFNSYLTYTGYPKSMFISITTLSYFLTPSL